MTERSDKAVNGEDKCSRYHPRLVDLACLTLLMVTLLAIVAVIFCIMWRGSAFNAQLVVTDLTSVGQEMLRGYSDEDAKAFMQILSDMTRQGKVMTAGDITANMASFYTALISVIIGLLFIVNFIGFVIIRHVNQRVIASEVIASLGNMLKDSREFQREVNKYIQLSVAGRRDAKNRDEDEFYAEDSGRGSEEGRSNSVMHDDELKEEALAASYSVVGKEEYK